MAATLRLPGEWRRYRGILLDIYFDHLLACRWDDYHPAPLERFCTDFYRHLEGHRAILPVRALHFCQMAPRVRWLESYRAGDRVPVMLDNVGKRLKRQVPLGAAWPVLEQDRGQLEESFEALMADLLESARPHLQEP